MTETQTDVGRNGDAQEAEQRMSMAEFRERMASWNRISTRTACIIGLGLVAVLVAALSLAVWFTQRPGLEEQRGLAGIGMAGVVLALMIAIGWLLYRQEQQVKSLGLVCPKCCRLLAGEMSRFLAMATRSCPHCHERFLADDPARRGDPDGAQAATKSVTLADLDAQQAAETKRFRRVFISYLAASLVCAGLSAVVIWYAGFWSFSFVPGATFYPLRILPMMIAVIVAGGGTIVASRSSQRQRTLQCQGCHDVLSHHSILRLTGNCTSCGSRTVLDPLMRQSPACEPAQNFLSRDEFRQRSRAIQKRTPLCCLAGTAAAFLWVAAVFWNAVTTARSNLRDEIDPLTAGLGCFGLVIQIGVVMWTHRRLERRLVCPACDQPLSLPHIVQATGCCTHCGRQVLSAPDDVREP